MASKPPRPPDAFLSYTRLDDRRERGKIGQLRKELEDEVRAVTGKLFEIFQDVDDIDIGERWSDKLDQILDEARFFIPIITPSYFESEACRDELAKFLKAEKAKGRADLVLPIYYIACDVLEDAELRTADPLATEIHRRQHHDWRALRHSSFSSKAVKIAFHELAQAIGRARRRVTPHRPEGKEARSASQEPSTVSRKTEIHAVDTLAMPDFAVLSQPEIRQPGTVFRDKDAPWCPEMVVIPPGEFMMGSTEAERAWAVTQGISQEWVEREKPQHRVHMAYPLAVGRHPVTFEEYDHFASRTRRALPRDERWGRARQPVINVSWEDARAYVEWLAAETRHLYRLLSEAEWEYACRAGTTSRYWWGDEITPEKANYGGNVGKTTQAGSYPASPFGLCDTHGNVWEWVEDSWHNYYDGARSDGSAWTAGNDSRRVLRGGSWSRNLAGVRSASRTAKRTDHRENKIGFRVARTLSGSESVTHSIQTRRKVGREGGKILDKPSRETGAGTGGVTTARHRIFLAHAREDKPQVRKLYADLKARGLDPWLDEVDLMPGQIWKEEIPKAIRQAGIFLACLSTRSVEKVGYVQNEFRLALSAFGERPPGSIFLVPARLDDCVVPDLQIPDRGLSLQDIHWVDLWQEGSFDRLVNAIEHAFGVATARREQPPAAISAPEQVVERRAEQQRPAAQGDDMQPGEVLYPDQSITSASGRYRFIYQDDGNLVLYDGGTALWASGTDGRPVGVCIMQGDGNLVIYARGGDPIWSSDTWQHPGSRLVVQDDGNVVIYRPDGTAVWATNTWLPTGRDPARPTDAKLFPSLPKPGTIFRDVDASWCPELVVIPPGKFVMGSTRVEQERAIQQGAQRSWVEWETPEHLVRIAYTLAVGCYPLTFEEYGHFARTTGRAQPDDKGWGRGRRPVINVNLEDAKSFIAWLSVQTRQQYRMLSEAEWEYACQAGTTTRFWWGDEITPQNANYGRNIAKTTEVGKYPANPFGLYDMHGNVWEWVEDCWNDSYDGAPNDGSAWTTGDCSRRVIRGASWDNRPELLRSASRLSKWADNRNDLIGFRVARML